MLISLNNQNLMLNAALTLNMLPTAKEKRKENKRDWIDMKGKVTNCTLKINTAITLPWEQTGRQWITILYSEAVKI